MTTDPSSQPAATAEPADDPVVTAAQALLGAIASEPLPPHLVALANALQAALGDRDRS